MTYAQKCGHQKVVATDGQQAVDAYKNACNESNEKTDKQPEGGDQMKAPVKPQVILMDINMPNLDGFQATQQIRAIEKKWPNSARRAFVVAMTGIGSPQVRQRAFASGIDLFFQKPVGV